MVPPTGLSFIVHTVIVISGKILDVFRIERSQEEPIQGTRTQAVFSIMIVVLMTILITTICTIFISRALADNRSNWKVVDRAVDSIRIKTANKNLEINDPPEINAKVYQVEARAPINPYPKNIKEIYQLVNVAQ